MTAPVVSVVIPTRNRPEAAAPALESARAQTYRDLEILVLDDASETPVVLSPDARADPRVRLARSAHRLGAGGARNRAVALTSGPLVAFLDDDDVWAPEKLARQVEALAACGPRTAAVEVGYELWDDGQRFFRYVPRVDGDLARTLLRVPRLQPSTALVRREAFEELGGFDETMFRVEDWEFWIRLAERYDVAVIPETLVRRELNVAVPPVEALYGFRELRRRMAPRLERLPAHERTAILADHDAQEGFLLYTAGHRGRGLAKLARAWTRRPRSLRAPRTTARALAGETAWRRGRRAALALRTRPLVRRW